MEEMEKRSDRHIRDPVARSAQGPRRNEIGCARIFVMAGAIAPFKEPNTDGQDHPPRHGRSNGSGIVMPSDLASRD